MSSEITSETHDWVVEINEELNNMESIPKKEVEYISHETPSIYRLDNSIRQKFSESDYTPRIVSFGPYYNGHKSCEPTERVKKNVLLHFLKKSNRTLDGYIAALKEDVHDLKAEYSELDPNWQQDDEAFLRLMIVDGCFLLELLREASKLLEADCSDSDYKSDNPVWGIDGLSFTELREYYIHDMLLLENQIPIRVLYMLCLVETNDYVEAVEQVNCYIHRLPSPCLWATKEVRSLTYHVLHSFRDTFLSGDVTRWVKENSMISYFPSNYFKTASATEFQFNIPSVTELDKVGIRFTTSKTMTLMDVSFSGRTLRLPQIFVDCSTKSIFLNIIALEQFHTNVKKEVTSYIYFMSKLLRDVDDVKLLESRGIIHSALSCSEIIEMFNNLTVKDIMCDPDFFLVSHYKLMSGNIRKGYNKVSNEYWRRDLWQNYLTSSSAFLVLALTAIQTIYIVLGYYNSR